MVHRKDTCNTVALASYLFLNSSPESHGCFLALIFAKNKLEENWKLKTSHTRHSTDKIKFSVTTSNNAILQFGQNYLNFSFSNCNITILSYFFDLYIMVQHYNHFLQLLLSILPLDLAEEPLHLKYPINMYS